MKPLLSLRLFVPAAAAVVLGTCLTPASVQASPGYSSVSANYRTAALPAGSMNPDTAVSDAPYDAFGFAQGGAQYQTVSDLDAWVNRATRYYNRYRGQRSPSYRYSPYRSRGGYYPNDPDDRNNPRHPNYIGPPGSYPRGYYYGNPYRNRGGYYPNDPDDRNNPNHPDYIGPPRWR